MYGVKCIVSLVILNIFGLAVGLVILPRVEENDIAKTEVLIRKMTNALFSSLKLRNIRNNSQLQHFSLIHNYFVSLTLQDYNSLKEIAKLTRINKGVIQNLTADFIVIINEILEEGNAKHETINIEHQLTTEMENLEHLKKMPESQYNKSLQLNNDVLKILQNEENLSLNVTNKATYKNYDDLLDDIPVWHEESFYGRRIFNGKKTKIQHFPFMASVQIFNKFQCGGCIIKSDLVITAAACLQLAWNNRFFRENPPFLSVRVGSSYYEYGGESIGVQEVYFHPGYNPKSLNDNLALMRLERKVNLSNKKVKKIAIDTKDHKLPSNTGRIKILGWGATSASNSAHGPMDDRLRYATLPIYPHDECRELYSKEFVTKENFCAGYISSGTAACNRDLGGPGIKSDILIGIISFGTPKCGVPDAPTVFTKLGFYYDWIEEIMEQDVPHAMKKTTSMPLTISYPINYSNSTSWTHTPLSTGQSAIEIFAPTVNALREKSKEQNFFNQYLKTVFENIEKKQDHTLKDNLKTSQYIPVTPPIDLETTSKNHSSYTFLGIPMTTKQFLNSSVSPQNQPFSDNKQLKGEIYDNIVNLIDENLLFNYGIDKENYHLSVQPIPDKQLSTTPMNSVIFNTKFDNKSTKDKELKTQSKEVTKKELELVITTNNNTTHQQQDKKSRTKKGIKINEGINKFTRMILTENPSTFAIQKIESLPIEKIQDQIKDLVKAASEESKYRMKELRESAKQILDDTDYLNAGNDKSAELESRIILELTDTKLKDREKYNHISQLVDITSLLEQPMKAESDEEPKTNELEYKDLSLLSTNEIDEVDEVDQSKEVLTNLGSSRLRHKPSILQLFTEKDNIQAKQLVTDMQHTKNKKLKLKEIFREKEVNDSDQIIALLILSDKDKNSNPSQQITAY